MSNKENFKIIAINVGKMLPTKDTRKNSLLTLDASKNLKKNANTKIPKSFDKGLISSHLK